MDVEEIEKTLDWLSENSQNLSEGQKKEVYDLLDLVRDQLETQTKMGLADDRNPKLSRFPTAMNRDEKKYHGHDQTDASLKSKIDRVTTTIDKETSYINSKIDTIAKDYNEQIETLKKKVRELEIEKNQREREEEKVSETLKKKVRELEIEKNQREREKEKVSDRDIDHVTESLKGLLNGVKKSRSFPSETIWLPRCGPEFKVPMVPTPNTPYFAHPHMPPQFHPPPPNTCGPSMFPPFPPNFGPNPGPSQMNPNVYRFAGGWGSAPDSYVGRGAGHPRPRFDRPVFPRSGDEKVHAGGKKYCDSFWKKFDHKNKEQGFKNEPPNSANIKPQHKTASQNEQHTSGDSNRGKFHPENRFKNHADRGKNQRYQQFGKNRPQNADDGNESDTSVSSHVSSKSTQKEFTHKPKPSRKFPPTKNPPAPTAKKDDLKPGPSCKFPPTENPPAPTAKKDDLKPGPSRKFPPTKNPPAPTAKKDDLKKQSNEETIHKDTPIPEPCTTSSKKVRKVSKPPHPNKPPQASSGKADTSDLQKLQYPSKAEALKQGIDITKKLPSPSMCLGKKNGEPVSHLAYCLKDIYDFEMKFESCQVVRF